MKLKQWTTATTAMLMLLCGGVGSAHADPVISVGAYTVGTPTFMVPIEISGAADLVTWNFDLAFDPLDVQALAVTEGPFTSGNGQFLTLFDPGFIDNVSGLISLVAGAYLDLPPGPSGDGVLAYVEFELTPDGTGNAPLTVQGTSVIQNGSNSVPEPATLTLVSASLLMVGALRRARRGEVDAAC
jgi:hypothetical protein